ncbi:MAG: hypothetical protein KGM47_05485, partial [Acidobacteriota bacterium]|nr:hypothetical protein [Acidobacteriota bacterium]
LVIVAVGLWSIDGELHIFLSGRHGHERYLAQAYYTMTSIDLVCLVVMLVAAVCLLRLRRLGLIICNYLFGFQIAYLFAFAVLALGLPESSQLAKGLAGAFGIGTMGTALEGGFVYPVVALVALNVAYRRLTQPKSSCAE